MSTFKCIKRHSNEGICVTIVFDSIKRVEIEGRKRGAVRPGRFRRRITFSLIVTFPLLPHSLIVTFLFFDLSAVKNPLKTRGLRDSFVSGVVCGRMK